MEQELTSICSRCKTEKPLREFMKNKGRENGVGVWCKLCRNQREKDRRDANLDEFNAKRRKKTNTPEGKALKKKYAAVYYTNNRETVITSQTERRAIGIAIVNAYKNIPCTDCHKSYPVECMELDHVRGTKKASVSNLTNQRAEVILEEIAKCEVVCMICHRIRTMNRRGQTKDKRVLRHHAMISDIKSCPCMDCGLTFPPIGMDFDHVRGEKVAAISNMTKHPRWKVLEEIAKCDIVCAFCHRIRTLARLQPIVHLGNNDQKTHTSKSSVSAHQ